MDDKLEKYRKRKKREELFESIKQKCLKMILPAKPDASQEQEVIQIPAVSESSSPIVVFLIVKTIFNSSHIERRHGRG